MAQPDIAKTRQTKLLTKILVVIAFSIAFAYIESAVVVYLRAIFHPNGFTFPLAEMPTTEQWGKLLGTEIGREAATMVLILTSCWLFGQNKRQRLAWFLIIFAVWDIFYYVWLKVLIDWPASIMDWDVLFLIPAIWASPVLAPVFVSLTMICFALASLITEHRFKFKVGILDWFGYLLAAVVIIVSFCLGGLCIDKSNYHEYFSWPLFAVGEAIATAVFLKCLLRSGRFSRI
jgi:hypothetical protein